MNLSGKRILVVEDDKAAGERLCEALRGAGAVALGPAPTEFYALQLLGRRSIDGAVLDIHLHGATVFGLADELVRRGTPIVFAVDDEDADLPGRFSQRPRIRKPYRQDDLMSALGSFDPARPTRPLPATPAPPDPVPAGAATSPQVRMARAVGAVMRRSAARVARRADP